MTIATAYTRFKQLVNGNMTNNNISVDKSRFVLLFNAEQTKFVENILDKKNDDTIRYISELLVIDKKLGKVGDHKTHSSFQLPENYFDLSSARAEGAIKGCIDDLKLFEVKAEDLEEKYNDWSHEPSFKFRETFYVVSEKQRLLVYKKDFDINKVFLNYYRKPIEVDIEGYTRLDKSPSTNIDPELQDRSVETILNMMAKEVAANAGDGGQYQIDKDRLHSPM